MPPVKMRPLYSRKKSHTSPSSKVEADEVSRTKLLDGTTVSHYWETLGHTHDPPEGYEFEWCPDEASTNSGYVGFRSKLGRAYYDSFRLNGTTWNVGEFVYIKEEGEVSGGSIEDLCRIVSAFQATRSFIGQWNSPGEDVELQNRGTYTHVAC